MILEKKRFRIFQKNLICHEEVPVGDIKGEKLTKTFLRKKVHIFTYRLIWKKIVFSRKTSYNGNVKGVPSIKYVGQIFYKFYKNVLKNQLDIYYVYYIYILNYQVSNTGSFEPLLELLFSRI